jgi:hypothetical protein
VADAVVTAVCGVIVSVVGVVLCVVGDGGGVVAVDAVGIGYVPLCVIKSAALAQITSRFIGCI